MINREEIVEFLKQEVAPLLNTLRVVDKTKVEKRGNPHLIVFPIDGQGQLEFVEERESFQDPEDWYFDSSAYDEYIYSLPDLWEKEYAAPLRQAIFRQLNTTYAGKADTYFDIEVEEEDGSVFVSLKPAAYRNLFPNSRTASYKDDPRWIAAKFAGIDANGNPFRKGQQVLYYPRTKTILTGKEADKAWREFEALSFDEDFSRFASSKTTTPSQWRSPMRRMSSTDAPLDPRKAVVYFDLSFEDYNLEEDLDNIDDINDRKHLMLLESYQANMERTAHQQEDEALKYLSRLFGARIGNEGHDSGGNLVCKISVDSYEDVMKISKMINRHHIGGDDQIDAGTYYFTAQGFTLYPQGVNGPRFSEDSRDDGTIEEWLEDNGPRARRASYAYADTSLKSASTTHWKAGGQIVTQKTASVTGKEILLMILGMDFYKALDHVRKEDPQSADMMRETFAVLMDQLQLDRNLSGSLARLKRISSEYKRMDIGNIRNNAFKAANSAGIRLPSAMF